MPVYINIFHGYLQDKRESLIFFSHTDVVDKDADTECKKLAVQALVLLENIIKQVKY